MVERAVEVNRLLDLLNGDSAAGVLVEEAERPLQFLIAQQLLRRHGGNDELGVIDHTALVSVNFLEHGLELSVRMLVTIEVSVAVFELINVQAAVTISVESAEDLVDVSLFGRRETLGRQECKRRLFENGLGLEVL